MMKLELTEHEIGWLKMRAKNEHNGASATATKKILAFIAAQDSATPAAAGKPVAPPSEHDRAMDAIDSVEYEDRFWKVLVGLCSNPKWNHWNEVALADHAIGITEAGMAALKERRAGV